MGTVTQVNHITIVRQLAAPAELVFQAWTDPLHLQQWFANPGAPAPSEPATVDLRVGGAWRLLMVENENKSYVTGGIYREIVRPTRLVFTFGAEGGWPDLDLERLDDAPIITVTLNEADGATEMIVDLGFVDTLEEERVHAWLSMGMREGLTQTLDRLAPHLERSAPGQPAR